MSTISYRRAERCDVGFEEGLVFVRFQPMGVGEKPFGVMMDPGLADALSLALARTARLAPTPSKEGAK